MRGLFSIPGRLLLLASLLLLSGLLMPPTAAAQPAADPRAAEGQAQLARCAAADAGQSLSLAFSGLPAFAAEVLSRHAIRPRIDRGRGELRIELHLDNLRALATPSGPAATTWLPPQAAARVMQDRRSRLAALWQLDEATVKAADRAYDIRQSAEEAAAGIPPVLAESEVAGSLPDYREVAVYTDTYTGFAALVLEAAPRPGRAPHRIYAVAGTHVFQHRDFRSWASGLTFGRAQFSSTAALRMLADAARYAEGPAGGEVVFTGQSQGGLTAQGLGFLLQSYLDARAAPHALVHVVSWGAVGAEEVFLRSIEGLRAGEGRGFSGSLETHWAATEPGYAEAAGFWSVIAESWRAIPPGSERAWIRARMAGARVLGYFFDIDLFARAGTFPGVTLAFPTALILPEACDTTVAEAVIGLQPGAFGVRLESHFLQGYRRAVARGAIALARPAVPAKWEWVGALAPPLEALGYLWLETLYFDGVASGARHWQQCQAAPRWMTPANRSCRAAFWEGCAPDPGAHRWCLVREGGPGPSPMR
ncbi:hypothetical protein BKE38_25875 [Pseudoroseomonas deserti]|uniref:Fungal lipase-like domain-containing protein n=1 Tax=Teichococcus deserti TaxID=1817963 RepID=A0A1V2GUW2_9PROT|nr:hypothetical protein [Pseudoroseomonas deserti]ONG45999.1 hypothetical protein BKE38_25875 [Pseudoroseomonas deserti]